MKNKIKLIFFYLILSFLNVNFLNAEKIEYTGNKIKILEEGNIVLGEGDIQIKIGQNIIIKADQFKYNRSTNLYNITNKVYFKDNLNKIEASSKKIVYSEKLGLIEIIDLSLIHI